MPRAWVARDPCRGGQRIEEVPDEPVPATANGEVPDEEAVPAPPEEAAGATEVLRDLPGGRARRSWSLRICPFAWRRRAGATSGGERHAGRGARRFRSQKHYAPAHHSKDGAGGGSARLRCPVGRGGCPRRQRRAPR